MNDIYVCGMCGHEDGISKFIKNTRGVCPKCKDKISPKEFQERLMDIRKARRAAR